ncbi:FAD/NAD(P)-binding domain-containing protein [Xylaria digitata]|nr:FAD/NAD(P)-binding domain-containing protein [Xylaria digitata]
MPLKVLIIGAGVCGPAFATLLQRADSSHEITIIERAPRMRESGLQIDLRAQGIPIVRKMGLIDAVRQRAVPETGVAFVDTRGRPFASFGKNDSGHGAQAFTSEYEIMRPDLVDVFYRASLGLSADKDNGGKAPQTWGIVSSGNGNVRYEFGVTVTNLSQHDAETVEVTFLDGRTAKYDLVVGADGQSSRTRRMILGGKEASDACFKPLDLFVAFYQIPRSPVDDSWMNWHFMTRRRAIVTRSADVEAPTQVYMTVRTSRKENAFGICTAGSIAEQKETFARAYADEGAWRVKEFVDALREKTPDEKFYATEIGQVHCQKLVVGRVVLVGDAGYCPSPITGMGTTLSLIGAYVLAGELAKHGKDGVPDALSAYARTVRPFVDEAQTLIPGLPGILYAKSKFGVWVLTTFFWLLSKLRIVDLLMKFAPDPEKSGGMEIPEYPELGLRS